MDKELVVRENLSKEMIKSGERLIKRLDQSNSNVEAALWFFSQDEKIWKMIIISPLVKTEGPRNYYKRILKANKTADESEALISLNDISADDTSNPLFNLFNKTVSTGNKITGIRLSKNTVNGTFIDDSYVYRININNSPKCDVLQMQDNHTANQ
jgi:hypothetical protein